MNLNSNEKRRSNTPKPISADVIAFLTILLGVGWVAELSVSRSVRYQRNGKYVNVRIFGQD